MQNVNPISKTEILIAITKGIFPFFGNILILSLIALSLYFIGWSYYWVLFIPLAIVVCYYSIYFFIVLMYKFLVWLIPNKRRDFY
jgi:hypothetical protein